MVNVIPHEGGDHVVGVIIERLQPQLARVTGLRCSAGKVLRLQLVVEESIGCSLINQDGGFGSRIVLDKYSSIILFASLNRAKVASESLLHQRLDIWLLIIILYVYLFSPWDSRWIDNWREGRH